MECLPEGELDLDEAIISDTTSSKDSWTRTITFGDEECVSTIDGCSGVIDTVGIVIIDEAWVWGIGCMMKMIAGE